MLRLRVTLNSSAEHYIEWRYTSISRATIESLLIFTGQAGRLESTESQSDHVGGLEQFWCLYDLCWIWHFLQSLFSVGLMTSKCCVRASSLNFMAVVLLRHHLKFTLVVLSRTASTDFCLHRFVWATRFLILFYFSLFFMSGLCARLSCPSRQLLSAS